MTKYFCGFRASVCNHHTNFVGRVTRLSNLADRLSLVGPASFRYRADLSRCSSAGSLLKLGAHLQGASRKRLAQPTL
ncbi:hypothetical protein WJX73_002223 [Symbiochloris irregularis]|uniref:Uncharacterized protein n=1 Tax=Symbiochloris irregularis TaxID=706552 RepID=A0AAW1NTQ6_9CHLO